MTSNQHALMRARWALVGKIFEEGRCPEDCPHYSVHHERHPYGSTTATETLADCRLGERGRDEPTDCPKFDEALEAQESGS